MDLIPFLLAIVAFGVLALGTINFLLLRIIRKMEKEIDTLQPPF